jgi:hypothetical protein
VLAHLSNNIDDFLRGEVGVDPRYVERRTARAVWLNDKYLTVATSHSHRAFSARPLKNRGELLSSFRKRKDCH